MGAWADVSLPKESFSRERLLFRVPFKTTSDEQFIRDKFHELAMELKDLPDEASIKDIDNIIRRHVKL